MMKALPKSPGLYKCPILEPRRSDVPAGVEKLQSQIFQPIQKSCDWSVTKYAIFVFQKSWSLMMKTTMMDVLRNVACLGNRSINVRFPVMSGMGG